MDDSVRDPGKKKRQAPQDEPKVVAGGGEDGVDLIASDAEKVVST